ncbi:hypothetical protein HanIR_Chr17g0872141 [Helianthus annuus]|nr:hypothetical protein HanIR_Chr17g0872141 [Helianthus annuus]
MRTPPRTDIRAFDLLRLGGSGGGCCSIGGGGGGVTATNRGSSEGSCCCCCCCWYGDECSEGGKYQSHWLNLAW